MTPTTYAPNMRGIRPKRRLAAPACPTVSAVPVSIKGACERLIALLDEEMEAIVAHDSESLAQYSPDKHALVRTLEQASAGLGADALDAETRALLTQCRERNRRNGSLLQIRHRHAERTLQILHGSDRHAGVYDGTGTAQGATLRPRYHASA